MCRFGGVDKTFKLCHKNCFMEIPIQEGVIDINVLDIPIFCDCEGADNPNSRGFYYRTKGVEESTPRVYWKPLATRWALCRSSIPYDLYFLRKIHLHCTTV